MVCGLAVGRQQLFIYDLDLLIEHLRFMKRLRAARGIAYMRETDKL
jgi:hypothetical protein